MTFADKIKDRRLAALHAYWLERKGDRRLPSRGDIDPLKFKYLLGFIMLVDVLPTHPRFRVRLHGSELVSRAGYDLTRKFLDDIPSAEYRSYVLDRCDSVVARAAPDVVRHERILDGHVREYEALWLPFSADGRDVTMLLCALIYDWRE